jgi:hypothetical protein
VLTAAVVEGADLRFLDTSAYRYEVAERTS